MLMRLLIFLVEGEAHLTFEVLFFSCLPLAEVLQHRDVVGTTFYRRQRDWGVGKWNSSYQVKWHRITTTLKSCKSWAFPLFRALKASWALYGVNDNVLPKAAHSWAWRAIPLLQGPCPKVLWRVRLVSFFLPTLPFCPPLFLTTSSPARLGRTLTFALHVHSEGWRGTSLCIPGRVRTIANFFRGHSFWWTFTDVTVHHLYHSFSH